MTKRKQTIPDLMIITGVQLIVCALPVGVVLSFERQPGDRPDPHWQIISGAVITVVVGLTGVVLFCIGETIVQRRWKRDKMVQK